MISIFRFLVQTVPLLLFGFYCGIRFGDWCGLDLQQNVNDFFISAENFMSGLVMSGVDWISAKFGGP
jgi:hypothetical protein